MQSLLAIKILQIVILVELPLANNSYAAPSNITETISLDDAISAKNAGNLYHVDLSWLFVFTVVGIIAFILRRKIRYLQEIGMAYLEKYTYELRLAKTPYDEFELENLRRIVNRIITNLQIVIAVYGILLTFVVTQKISAVFFSWVFSVWCGWILAVVIRAGIFSFTLSDLLETEDLESARRKVYAANRFYKHSLYLLAAAIALLPSFFITPSPNMTTVEDVVNKFHWTIDIAIISAATAIFIFWSFFYGLVMRATGFEKLLGGVDIYFLGIIGVSLSSLQYVNNSPLDEIRSSLFGAEVTIPSVAYVLLLGGMLFGFLMLATLAQSTIIILERWRHRRKLYHSGSAPIRFKCQHEKISFCHIKLLLRGIYRK